MFMREPPGRVAGMMPPVIGVLGGLAAAVLWGLSAVCGAQASRILGSVEASAWVLGLGFAILIPFAVGAGAPPDASAEIGVWTAVTAVTGLLGFVLMYAALRAGPVSLVTPIVSAEGAVAAAIAVAAGEPLSALAAVARAAVVVGTVVVVRRPPGDSEAHAHVGIGAVSLAVLCAIVFGLALYASA